MIISLIMLVKLEISTISNLFAGLIVEANTLSVFVVSLVMNIRKKIMIPLSLTEI